ncbi:prolyl aminopeptidase [Sinomonas sp. JGH33]|uniref:Proline iminopeptidase n=1 Tax=Sinomonas terricola TaxID=3110330 RepID=A0ABU5T7U7_9MICC|nr:prolyl aminopeptidase [Sinomonas sp. JGH33]MEA5455762.1 prolyl aminopeptidase [Sinomonas sp. JGH33]
MKYAPLVPFDSGLLELHDGAQLYWEASGKRDGLPALWLHGGPGSGLGTGGYRRHFDPDRYLIVGIDQRGCGRSRPLVSHAPETLASNTTERLIADIEQLREWLGIEHWVLAGASWGSTLALAYSLAHPDRVLGLALVAVTTTGRDEVDWITEGIGRVFPEAWQEFADASQREDGERVVDAYARRLASADPVDRAAAALAWDVWENIHISLDSPDQRGSRHDDDSERLGFAMLVTHYWSNDAFLRGPEAILARVSELKHIPAHLIHGRRDISGPAITAWQLHREWPSSTLCIVEDEGHGGPREMELLDAALDRLAARHPSSRQG